MTALGHLVDTRETVLFFGATGNLLELLARLGLAPWMRAWPRSGRAGTGAAGKAPRPRTWSPCTEWTATATLAQLYSPDTTARQNAQYALKTARNSLWRVQEARDAACGGTDKVACVQGKAAVGNANAAVRQGQVVLAGQLLRQISPYPLPAHLAGDDLLRIAWAELFLAQQHYAEAETVLNLPGKTSIHVSNLDVLPYRNLLLALACWGSRRCFRLNKKWPKPCAWPNQKGSSARFWIAARASFPCWSVSLT